MERGNPRLRQKCIKPNNRVRQTQKEGEEEGRQGIELEKNRGIPGSERRRRREAGDDDDAERVVELGWVVTGIRRKGRREALCGGVRSAPRSRESEKRDR